MQYSPESSEISMLVKNHSFEFVKENPVGHISAYFQQLPHVLNVVILAELERGTGKNPCQGCFCGSIVVCDDTAEWILHPPQHTEKLLVCELIFRGS